jgi:hypothetical protein
MRQSRLVRKPRGKGLSPHQIVEDEVARLRDLDLTALKVRWLNEYSRKAPKHLTRHLLFRILPTRSKPIV